MSAETEVPVEVATIKANVEAVLGHTLDLSPLSSGGWKLLYRNPAGVRLFYFTVVCSGGEWRLKASSHILPMTECFEAANCS